MNKQQLLDLKDKIEESKEEVNRLEGKKENLMQTLSEEHGCESIQDAKKLLKKIKSEIQETESKIDKGTKKLKEKFDLG